MSAHRNRLKLVNNKGKFICRLTKPQAEELLSKWGARVAENDSLAIVQAVLPYIKYPAILIACAERFPRYVVGGLTRTETQPRVNFKK